ncbi:hypothetical protein PTKIN_Ptkin11bG0089500 [Pterospermum kingtungense]
MQSDYRLEPELDHYTCIIDCLGRAGHFHDAELLMDKMPYKMIQSYRKFCLALVEFMVMSV